MEATSKFMQQQLFTQVYNWVPLWIEKLEIENGSSDNSQRQ